MHKYPPLRGNMEKDAAYDVGTPARLRASMPKPSDILGIRIVIHHFRTKLDGCRDVQNCDNFQRHDVQLMSVAARQRVSVTQKQETDANLSQNCSTKLCRDLCDTHTHPTKLLRTFVCRFGVGISHILKTWSLADSKTLGGRLSLQPQK